MSRDLEERMSRVVYNPDGLVPAIIQQHDTREVLMLGWMDAEALRRTLTEGRVTFWSRNPVCPQLPMLSGVCPVPLPQ